MATARFSRMEVAPKAVSLEALVRSMAEAFGQKAVKASRFEKQREAIRKREIKKWQEESRGLCEWTFRYLLPAAGNYQSALIDQELQAFSVYAPDESERLARCIDAELAELNAQIAAVRQSLEATLAACREADGLADGPSVVQAYRSCVAPCLESLRRDAEQLAVPVS